MPCSLQMQVKQPGPAVGPLEASAKRPVQIGEFGRDLLRGEGGLGEARNIRIGVKAVESQ
jgi:hypothetical protein